MEKNDETKDLRFDNCKDGEDPDELSENDWEEVNDFFLNPDYD